jgi:purine catabolism regulator
MAGRVYTIGDLLSEPELGLELLVGGPDALQSPVAGAHAIELENPAKWLDAGWMMLTMGSRVRNKPKLQRELVAELNELGASCLGFGVGPSFKNVPVALLDEAARREFPVILVPEGTQFRDIARAVFQSTVGVEAATFQRLTTIQQNLIKAFADDDPLRSIVRRLARMVSATVAVISLDGEVDASSGEIPVAGIAAALRDEVGGFMATVKADDWWAVGVPVTASPGLSARWLVEACRRRTVSDELSHAALQVSAPLVNAMLRLSATSQGQDQAIRQALLDSVLDDRPETMDVRAVEARVAAVGIDFGAGFRAVVIRERPAVGADRYDDHVALEGMAPWMYGRLESLGARYLLSRRAGEIVAVVDSGPALEFISAECGEEWPCLIGIGRDVHSVMDIRTSHRDAQIVAQHLTVTSEKSAMRFDELDVVTQLLAEVPLERFAAKAAPIAALLAANPLQLEALRAFFAMNRDIKAAADSIFVHPNTLRYRLERLEQSLGRSLREPSVTASLYCVLTLMSDLAPDVGAAASALPERWNASDDSAADQGCRAS